MTGRRWASHPRKGKPMAITIIYEIDCHCGGTAEHRTLHMDNPQPDGTIRIDIEMAAAQSTFECEDCGCTTYTGDLDSETDPDECPGPMCEDCGEREDDCTCADDEAADDTTED